MNTTYRPQSRLMYQMPATLTQQAEPVSKTTTRRGTGLSARQLLDVELGLFLLSQLLPTAQPDTLPVLLAGNTGCTADCPAWTARQYRYLNRARLLLSHFRDRSCWLSQIGQYATGSSYQQAYVISPDHRCVKAKPAGFFRDRLVLLRQMLG